MTGHMMDAAAVPFSRGGCDGHQHVDDADGAGDSVCDWVTET